MRDSSCVTTAVVRGRRRMAGDLLARVSKIGFATGVALAATLFAAAGAQAQCTGTGGAAVAGGVNLAPFAAGGSINVLASAINAANTVFLTQSTAFIGSPSNPQPNQTGGGVWARSIGGEQTTKSTGLSTYALGGVPLSGNITCHTSTQVSFGGVQIGTDISTLNFNGWNLHGGSTLGYLGATGTDTTSPGAINPLGGTLGDNLLIPFVGVYGAATKGNLFVDGQARWLYFQNGVSDSQNGLFNQHFDARSLAINADIGYNFQLQNNWFIEPSGGFIWSETGVDPLNTSGTVVLGTGLSPAGTVSVANMYSAIGRLSVRVGTTVDTGNMLLQPFGSASFFREFDGNANATLNGNYAATGVPAPSVVGALSTTGIGNYAQFGLGVATQIKDTGWLGYFRADYRTGDSIQGWSVNGGARYQFSPDMIGQPIIAKGPEPVSAHTVYDWTGLRIGAMLGADWGYTNWNFVGGGGTSPRFAGMLPGGLIGYDYQIGKWVAGAGADMGWTNAQGASACPNMFYFTCENHADWLSTATGRLGYTFWGDRILTYAKAGLALGDYTAKYSCNTDSQATVGISLLGCPNGSTSKIEAGWIVGAGTEFALNEHWSVRAETNYFDLGKDRYPLVEGGVPLPVDIAHQGYIATIGLAYRFDVAPPGAPVVAKY